MLDRYYSPAEFAEVQGISLRKAYDIIHREIPHQTNPLRVSERAIREWRERTTVYPMPVKKRRTA